MPDLASDIIDYENGNMDYIREMEFFQRLVNTGVVWNLQGSYQRKAKALIESGEITSDA